MQLDSITPGNLHCHEDCRVRVYEGVILYSYIVLSSSSLIEGVSSLGLEGLLSLQNLN